MLWLVSGVDWLVCARFREKVKSDGLVRLAAEYESDIEMLAARRLADVSGESGSCTD